MVRFPGILSGMELKLFRLPVFVVYVLLGVSCSSVRGVRKNTGEAVMYGMVYNGENVPVSGAVVW
jgi:hypothetical protein